MARSEEYRALPRKQGRGYVSPSGERVTEWFVRQLRAKEAGYASPREMTAFRKSQAFREIIEKAAKESNVTQDEVALDRAVVADFRKAFVRPEGGFRTWAEAERQSPEAVGRILWDSGQLTEQEYYCYFAPPEERQGYLDRGGWCPN